MSTRRPTLLFIWLVYLAADVHPWSESSCYHRRSRPVGLCIHQHRRLHHGKRSLQLLRGEYHEDETWDERRMRLLWEADPFDAVKSHLGSMLRGDNDNGSILRFVSQGVEGDIAATDNVFSSFYEGLFPDKLSSTDQYRNISKRRRRKESFRLDLAYNGQCFCGWQRQPEDKQQQFPLSNDNQATTTLSSVQATIENAFLNIFTSETQMDVRAAGRTDAGVHAFGQVGRVRIRVPSVENGTSSNMEDLLYAKLNCIAARDGWKWRCWAVTHVTEKFHPTFGARDRSYVYMVDADIILKTFRMDATTLIRRCNALLCQIEDRYLDYFSLSYGNMKTKSSLCYLSHARARLLQQVARKNDIHTPHQDNGNKLVPVLAIELTGNRFLRRMVRKLVATVLQLTLHGTNTVPDDVSLLKILRGRDRRASAMSAPPSGLVFVGASFYDV